MFLDGSKKTWLAVDLSPQKGKKVVWKVTEVRYAKVSHVIQTDWLIAAILKIASQRDSILKSSWQVMTPSLARLVPDVLLATAIRKG